MNKFLELYGINQVKKVEKISKGYVNELWKIESDNGAFLLKCFNNCNLDRLKYLINLESNLSEFSPKLISTSNGSKIITKNEKSYVMYEFINGINLNRDDITLLIAKKLGKLLR